MDVSNLIGKISVFPMFIVKPEHSPKVCKILLNLDRSLAVGAENIAASSAYREHLSFAVFGRIGWRKPLSAAISMMHWRGSIARMNSNGESGSPCLNPPACLMLSLAYR